jgi:hypothetical protein
VTLYRYETRENIEENLAIAIIRTKTSMTQYTIKRQRLLEDLVLISSASSCTRMSAFWLLEI